MARGRRFHAHPGELAVAEGFAIAVQQRLAAAACAEGGAAAGPTRDRRGAARVRVAASVHTDAAMFVHSQPALVQDDGARLVAKLPFRIGTSVLAPFAGSSQWYWNSVAPHARGYHCVNSGVISCLHAQPCVLVSNAMDMF